MGVDLRKRRKIDRKQLWEILGMVNYYRLLIREQPLKISKEIIMAREVRR